VPRCPAHLSGEPASVGPVGDLVIANPIINGPDDEPARHFRFDADGITDQVDDGRRPSSYFVPVPRPRKGRAQLEIPELTADQIEVNQRGGPISAEAALRIACDAGITRVITDPAGVPLGVGRESRTVTPGQWAALVARDRGCAFPGCTRPPEWCSAHHITHWADGGPTDLDNLVLLCGHYHRVVHHRGWHVRMAADRYPEFLPPPWVEPDQTPRRDNRPRYERAGPQLDE
jgi:hypothetical protein